MTKHQESISNFSWCPAPINIFNSNTDLKELVTVKATVSKTAVLELEKVAKIYDVPENENVLKDTENIIEEITNVEVPKYGIRKQGEYKKVDKKNLWTNLNYGDSDEEAPQEQQTVHLQEKNFLQECQNLRKAILGDSDENDSLPETCQSLVEEDKENLSTELLSEAMGNVSLNSTLGKSESEVEIQDDNCGNTPQRRFIKEEDAKEYLLASVCLRGYNL